MNNNKAYYLSVNDNIAKTKHGRIWAVIASFFMVLTIVAAPIAATLSSTSLNTAYAKDEESTLTDAANKDGVQKDSKGLDIAVKKTTNTDLEKNRDTFRFVMNRIMNTLYMNDVRESEAGGENDTKRDWLCSLNDPLKNTALYHNCDIPNIATDFYQKVIQVLFPMGFSEAGIETAKVPFSFGVPSQIPGGEVPLTYKSGSIKYSSLETFGYGMHYTGYNGEWDHIQVYNSIRALSNFGLMDDIKLGIKTAVGSFIAGAGAAANASLESLAKGDPIGAITKGWSAFWGTAVAHAVNKIIDTSDLNVVNNYGWYRVDYGATLYNARELTQEELGAAMVRSTKAMFGEKKAEAAKAAEDLEKHKNGPPGPRASINECMINGTPFLGKLGVKNYAGVSKAECDAEAKAKDTKSTFKTRPQNVTEWKSEQAGILALNNTYSLGCKMPGSLSEIKTFTECWAKAAPGAIQKAKGDAQTELNKIQTDSVFNGMLGFFKRNPRNNYNAPFNRFVCTDKNGNDMKTSFKGGDYAVNPGAKDSQIFLYSVKGKVNPACSPVRPPIQNALFGNGYGAGDDNIIKFNNDDKGKSVPLDGRRSLYRGIGILGVMTAGSDTIANELINFTSMTTRISNTALDFSFSPVLGHLEMEKHFVEWINAFRDSVYFGLIGLVFAISGLTVFGKAIKNTNPMQGLKDALIMVGIFFFGVILLYTPKLLFSAIDTIPSMAETTIAGTIFQASSKDGDQTCTTTGSITPSKDSKEGESLSGSSLDFSPRDSVRTMECEVWRAFALNPYIYGQWGTGYNNLFSDKFGNTNSALVGNADVELGAGRKVNNWGLYQLSLLTSGTSSYDANITGDASQVIPRDLYRIVDAQAGPNNNAGVNNKYFGDWSGSGGAGPKRVFVTLYGNIVSVFGLITIVSYSLVKIELTLMSFVMLLLIPIMLLIGIHPTAGRVQLKKYFGTIIGLMVQRIALVALLAIMIKLISGAGQSSDNYFMAGTAILALCLLFLLNRKKFLKMFTSPIDTKFGGSMINVEEGVYSHAKKTMPKSMQNRMDSTKGKTKGMIGGAAAGYSVNGVTGIGKAMDNAKDMEERRAMRRSTRRGLGLTYQLEKSTEAGTGAVKKKYKGSDLTNDLNKEINDMYGDKEIDARKSALASQDAVDGDGNKKPEELDENGKPIPPISANKNENENNADEDNDSKSGSMSDAKTNVHLVDDLNSNKRKNIKNGDKTQDSENDEDKYSNHENSNHENDDNEDRSWENDSRVGATTAAPQKITNSSNRENDSTNNGRISNKDYYDDKSLRQKAMTELRHEGFLKNDVKGNVSDENRLSINLDDRQSVRMVAKIDDVQASIASLNRKKNRTESKIHDKTQYAKATNNYALKKNKDDDNNTVTPDFDFDSIDQEKLSKEIKEHKEEMKKYDKELAKLKKERDKVVEELLNHTKRLKDLDEADQKERETNPYKGFSNNEIRKESLKDMRRELGEAFRVILPIYGDGDKNKDKIDAPYDPEDDMR